MATSRRNVLKGMAAAPVAVTLPAIAGDLQRFRDNPWVDDEQFLYFSETDLPTTARIIDIETQIARWQQQPARSYAELKAITARVQELSAIRKLAARNRNRILLLARFPGYDVKAIHGDHVTWETVKTTTFHADCGCVGVYLWNEEGPRVHHPFDVLKVCPAHQGELAANVHEYFEGVKVHGWNEWYKPLELVG